MSACRFMCMNHQNSRRNEATCSRSPSNRVGACRQDVWLPRCCRCCLSCWELSSPFAFVSGCQEEGVHWGCTGVSMLHVREVGRIEGGIGVLCLWVMTGSRDRKSSWRHTPFLLGMHTVPSDGYGCTIDSHVTGTAYPSTIRPVKLAACQRIWDGYGYGCCTVYSL
jgi:hypothetical protein